MNPQFGAFGGGGDVNPQMGMNQGMMPGMNPGMMPGMMPCMQNVPLTEAQKQQLRKQSFVMVRKIPFIKQSMEAKNQEPAFNQSANNPERPATGEITVKFNKGGNITSIKRDADSLVA